MRYKNMLTEEEEEIEKSMLQISQLVKGKRIAEIVYKDPMIGERDYLCDIEIDASSSDGECYIVLDDGSVIRAWNSEWGGIELMKAKNK